MARPLAPAVPLPDGLRTVIVIADALHGDDDDWSLGGMLDCIGAVELTTSAPVPCLGVVVSEYGRAVISIADRVIGSRVETLVRARLMAGAITIASTDGGTAVDVARRCDLFDNLDELALWRSGLFLAVSRCDAEDCASGARSAVDIGHQRGVPPIAVRVRVLYEILLGRLDSAEHIETILARLTTMARTGAEWLDRELSRLETPLPLRCVRGL